MELSKTTLKALTDITGETKLEVAINSTLRDALEHRMEMIEKDMKNFEKKYRATFSEFKKKWREGKIKDKFSYRRDLKRLPDG